MKYNVVQEYYIDPDSIELEDFCNICQYVRNNCLLIDDDDYILSLMTSEHVMNTNDSQLAVAYLPQKYDRYKFVAEIRMISLDGEHWICLEPITVELKILSPSFTMKSVKDMTLAFLSMGEHEYRLYKSDFDIILQEKKEENEEAFNCNDGNSGIGEELNS